MDCNNNDGVALGLDDELKILRSSFASFLRNGTKFTVNEFKILTEKYPNSMFEELQSLDTNFSLASRKVTYVRFDTMEISRPLLPQFIYNVTMNYFSGDGPFAVNIIENMLLRKCDINEELCIWYGTSFHIIIDTLLWSFRLIEDEKRWKYLFEYFINHPKCNINALIKGRSCIQMALIACSDKILERLLLAGSEMTQNFDSIIDTIMLKSNSFRILKILYFIGFNLPNDIIPRIENKCNMFKAFPGDTYWLPQRVQQMQKFREWYSHRIGQPKSLQELVRVNLLRDQKKNYLKMIPNLDISIILKEFLSFKTLNNE